MARLNGLLRRALGWDEFEQSQAEGARVWGLLVRAWTEDERRDAARSRCPW